MSSKNFEGTMGAKIENMDKKEYHPKQDSIVREWAEKLEMYLGNNNQLHSENQVDNLPCM